MPPRAAVLLAVLALVVVTTAARPASAADISIDKASLSFDPNAKTWHLASEVCNESDSGYSGSLLYELRLLADGRYWSIGSTRSTKNLNAGACRSYDDLAIKVNTNVPRGTYEIQFVVSEYDGSRYLIRDTTKFNRTFIRRGGE